MFVVNENESSKKAHKYKEEHTGKCINALLGSAGHQGIVPVLVTLKISKVWFTHGSLKSPLMAEPQKHSVMNLR